VSRTTLHELPRFRFHNSEKILLHATNHYNGNKYKATVGWLIKACGPMVSKRVLD
jgi:hypothetical protein